MNLDQKEKNGFPFSFVGITVAIGFASLFLLGAVLTLLLSKIDHFENYYTLANWLILALTGVVIAVISRLSPEYAMLNSALSSGILSLLRFGIGLAINGTGIRGILSVLIESGVLIGISVLTSVFLTSQKKKRKHGPTKFKFQNQ